MTPDLKLIAGLLGEVEKYLAECGAPLTDDQLRHLDHARVAALARYSA